MAEQQLNLIGENAGRGGSRSGSGRKRKRSCAPERTETSKVRVCHDVCRCGKTPHNRSGCVYCQAELNCGVLNY